ncbi:hypothetical protein ASZ90_018201 [hydrocarbon metagenome]|uniref:Uncharacterized protein n=1 Tax=hydrocarbon metagenome TaxID=938273 RepID=A0A0W8E735_9ZZZZ
MLKHFFISQIYSNDIEADSFVNQLPQWKTKYHPSRMANIIQFEYIDEIENLLALFLYSLYFGA